MAAGPHARCDRFSAGPAACSGGRLLRLEVFAGAILEFVDLDLWFEQFGTIDLLGQRGRRLAHVEHACYDIGDQAGAELTQMLYESRDGTRELHFEPDDLA